jgi:hypothetical protein
MAVTAALARQERVMRGVQAGEVTADDRQV